MIAALVLVALAGGDPADLRVRVADDATVNWTTLTLEVASSARGHRLEAAPNVVEHDARVGLPSAVDAAALSVRVTPDATFEVLSATGPDTLRRRTDRWVVGEGRYFSSGRIELVATLPLLDLLRPWILQGAPARPTETREPAFTGVVIDARGTGVEPAWAPEVRGASGRLLWDGRVWRDAALTVTPVTWVSTPLHPAVARAGEHPLVVRVASAIGATMTLGPLDTATFQTTLSSSALLGDGAVVIVADP